MKKKLLSLSFALILMIGVLPSQVFAIEADDPQLEAFLETIDWELEDYENYLADYGFELADFEDPFFLGTPLTEEGLEEIYATYDLTYEELDNLLREEEGFLQEGEEFPDSFMYMFIEDIEYSLDWILNDPLAETEGGFDEEITDEGLEDLVASYGLNSIEELEEFLNMYQDSINNYTTLFEVESAVAFYLEEEAGSTESNDDLWEEDELLEEDDLLEVDDPFESNMGMNPSLDLMDMSILSDEPVVDIYTILSLMFLEALADVK